jgi:hypothetical protein
MWSSGNLFPRKPGNRSGDSKCGTGRLTGLPVVSGSIVVRRSAELTSPSSAESRRATGPCCGHRNDVRPEPRHRKNSKLRAGRSTTMWVPQSTTARATALAADFSTQRAAAAGARPTSPGELASALPVIEPFHESPLPPRVLAARPNASECPNSNVIE